MWKNPNKPDFGLLDGVKVVHSSTNMAGPMGVTLLADHGADVVWIENPRFPDTSRVGKPNVVNQERRNSRNLCVSISTPEGKEVLKRLLTEADIFIEGSKPGQYKKWGLTDEVLWSWNPRLVIVHISGYGQYGDPDYVSRGGYDGIGQAASGFMYQNNGSVAPFSCDAQCAVYIAFSSVAAMYRAQRTGQGESIDLAQYEIMLRQQIYATDYATAGTVYGDESKFSTTIAGWGPYTAADGQDVYVVGIGANTMKVGLPWLGIPYGTDLNPAGGSLIAKNTECGNLLDEKLTAYVGSVPAAEAEKELLAHSIPCSRVMTYKDLLESPHVKERGSFVTWTNYHGQKITGVAPVPQMKNAPGQVWGPAPSMGMHNEEIMEELGFSSEEIREMYEKGLLRKEPVEKFPQ